MEQIGDNSPHRGAVFDVYEISRGSWQWAYYPKVGTGFAVRGQLKGTREDAVAACKAAIDKWLGPELSAAG
jgi:hypothetical protein